MKALSLWQPWASAMFFGWKRIETRGWSTDYRGPLAIHASKRWTADERETWAAMARAEGFDAAGYEVPLGAVICTVCLVDVRPTDELRPTISAQEERWGNYGTFDQETKRRRFGFLTTGLQRLPQPVPFTGKQGFFDVPDTLLEIPQAPPPPPRGKPDGRLL
jgi:hypothetical protein